MVFLVPALRSRFLEYGARTATKPEKDTRTGEAGASNALTAVLDNVARLRVPHSWFTSFYAVSVTSSLFWGAELLIKGPAFRALASCVPVTKASMTSSQVTVVWAMMLAQGSRRLYECLAFSRPSQSQMWLGHWILGIAFYVGTGIAVWIEGACKSIRSLLMTKSLILQQLLYKYMSSLATT